MLKHENILRILLVLTSNGALGGMGYLSILHNYCGLEYMIIEMLSPVLNLILQYLTKTLLFKNI